MSKINVEPSEFNNDSLTIDEGEKALLNGMYSMKQYINPHPDLEKIIDEFYNQIPLFHAKKIYMCGNILYKTDEPNIEDMMDLMIRSTYAKKLPNFVDTSVYNKNQMRSGTICPTKEVIFRNEGKLFILYGWYIYGYDKPYVSFLNDDPKVHKSCDEDDDDYKDDGDDDDDKDEDLDSSDIEERERDAQISRDEIIVPTVVDSCKDIPMNDYNYVFSIVDEKTGILNAFANYR